MMATDSMSAAGFNREILRRIEEFAITRLVHFTRMTSLTGINHDRQVASTRSLLNRGVRGVVNDPQRLDRHLDYVCCSIQFPNLYLLDDYRKKRPEQEWVHLCLTPALLALPSTRFSPVNAASQGGSRICGGIDGFQSMFADRVLRQRYGGGWQTSRRKGRFSRLPDYLPTDSQAEVLVQGAIPIDAVEDVVVESEQVADRVRHLTDKLPVSRPSVQRKLFDKDYVGGLWDL